MEELPDIFNGISRPGLFEKFKEQLKKDFEGGGLNGEFALALLPDYDLVLKAVNSEIERINKLQPGKLPGLLYRIDISELQVKRLSNEKKGSSMDEIISELIIKRELQKIVIKEHFKNK